MSTHLIIGTGPLGRAVMEELVLRGESVRMLNRSGKMPEAPQGVAIIAGDAYDPACIRKLAHDASVVYQCAQPPYHQWVEKFPALQAAIIAGLTGGESKLVIGDNLYMYGHANGAPLREDLPYRAATRKGRTRAAMAEAALQAHTAGKLRVTLARGSDFYGPWALGSTMGERVFYPALQGKPASLVGRLDLPHTHTYIKDFGKALVVLGQSPAADGQAWHVPNDRPTITQGEFVRLIFEEIGLPPKMSGMGRMMMAIGGLFIPEARETLEMMYEFTAPFVVDSSRFEQQFGLKPTPISQAIRETVAWYKSHPA